MNKVKKINKAVRRKKLRIRRKKISKLVIIKKIQSNRKSHSKPLVYKNKEGEREKSIEFYKSIGFYYNHGW